MRFEHIAICRSSESRGSMVCPHTRRMMMRTRSVEGEEGTRCGEEEDKVVGGGGQGLRRRRTRSEEEEEEEEDKV